MMISVKTSQLTDGDYERIFGVYLRIASQDANVGYHIMLFAAAAQKVDPSACMLLLFFQLHDIL